MVGVLEDSAIEVVIVVGLAAGGMVIIPTSVIEIVFVTFGSVMVKDATSEDPLSMTTVTLGARGTRSGSAFRLCNRGR